MSSTGIGDRRNVSWAFVFPSYGLTGGAVLVLGRSLPQEVGRD